MRSLLIDIRGAARGLSRGKVAAATAVLAVMLGISSNVAAFGVVRGLLFRDLPYRDADQLVFVWQCRADGTTDYSTLAHFDHWQQQGDVFSDVSVLKDASKDIHFDLTGAAETERVSGAKVLPNYLRLLGVQPLLGSFHSDQPGAVEEIVISHGFWKRAFAGAPDIVGRKVMLGDQPRIVVGVMRPDFVFVYDSRLWSNRTIKAIDFWLPLRLPPAGNGLWREVAYRVIGRLRNDISASEAQNRLSQRWPTASVYNAKSKAASVCVVPFNRAETQAFAPILWLLLLGSALVALVACANLAIVLVARAVETDREGAVMVALGASQLDVARRYAIEGLLLSVPGGLGAILLTTWLLNALRGLLPPWILGADALSMDLPTLTFGLLVTMVVGLTAGGVTATAGARRSLVARFAAGAGASFGPAARGLWSRLLIAEIAVACVLGAVGLQAFESHTRLTNVKLGYAPQGIRTFKLALTSRHGGPRERLTFLESMQSDIASLPFVTDVAIADQAPLRSRGSSSRFEIPGQASASPRVTSTRLVDERYFSALGIRVVRGRGIQAEDASGTPWVAVVNNAFWQRHVTGEPLGALLDFGDGEAATIVGIVDDVRDVSLRAAAEPTAYFSLQQSAVDTKDARSRLPNSYQMLIAGGTADAALWKGLRRIVAAHDRNLPVQDVASLENDIVSATSDHRLGAGVLASLAGTALLLALTGVYGVTSYSVSQRARELAIRLAIGAGPEKLHRMLVLEMLKRAGAGLLIGVPAAFAAAAILRAHLFEAVGLTAPQVTSAAIAILVSSAAATLFASRKLADFDPMVSLRRD